jgi:hypothetical protein
MCTYKQKRLLKEKLVTVFSCDLFVTCRSFSPCVSGYMLYSVYPFAIMFKTYPSKQEYILSVPLVLC